MACTVGYIQTHPEFGAVERNRDAAWRLADRAKDADLLVFPELALMGYEFRDDAEARQYAEPFGEGPTATLARQLASERNATVVIGYPEETPAAVYNACLLARPDGAMVNYRKLHLFSREKDLFAPGDAPAPVVDTPVGRVGLMVCFDWFFPETARMLALQGAQIIAHPSNLVLDYCQRAMYARCVENRVFAITANRVGTESRAGRTLTFTGGSQILDWRGTALASAPLDEEHVATAIINPADAQDKSLNEYNDLFKDRRVDMYGALLDQPESTLDPLRP